VSSLSPMRSWTHLCGGAATRRVIPDVGEVGRRRVPIFSRWPPSSSSYPASVGTNGPGPCTARMRRRACGGRLWPINGIIFFRRTKPTVAYKICPERRCSWTRGWAWRGPSRTYWAAFACLSRVAAFIYRPDHAPCASRRGREEKREDSRLTGHRHCRCCRCRHRRATSAADPSSVSPRRPSPALPPASSRPPLGFRGKARG
jgi:hypothetical protein